MTFTTLPCACGHPVTYLEAGRTGFRLHCYGCGARRPVTADQVRSERAEIERAGPNENPAGTLHPSTELHPEPILCGKAE